MHIGGKEWRGAKRGWLQERPPAAEAAPALPKIRKMTSFSRGTDDDETPPCLANPLDRPVEAGRPSLFGCGWRRINHDDGPADAFRPLFQAVTRQSLPGRVHILRQPPGGQVPRSVVDAVASYLEHRQSLVDAGELSASSVASDHYRLVAFKTFCQKKGVKLLAGLDSDFLESYRNMLLKRLAGGKLSPVSVKHALRTVKAFMRRLHKKEVLDKLPRMLDGYADITLGEPKPEFFTDDEVNKLLAEANDRTKLYILLGLNLGYTQADIASLEHKMINWATGIVDRKRHKNDQPQRRSYGQ